MTAIRAGAKCRAAVLPAESGNPDRLIRSLNEAVEFGGGDFSEISLLPEGAATPREALRQAAEAALANGAGWLLAVSAAETLAPDIFVKTAPALRLHDAVWGGAGLSLSAPASSTQNDPTSSPSPRGGGEQVGAGRPERITRLAAQDLPGFFHAALAWWIGPSHFVRPAAALAALRAAEGEAWYADYLDHLWRNVSAYKTAQLLTRFSETVPPVSDVDRARLVRILEEAPVFMPVSHGGLTLRLPYTGLNPVIEREQMRGLFFEHDELRFLAARLPRGLRVIDAGANTGNHTVFFAAVMQAELVTPFEPHPRAVAAIKAAAAENALDNVDLSRLGIALGAGAGRLRAVHSITGGLGATRYFPDPEGETRLMPLDAMDVDTVDFMKIDLEGMEMALLAGASGLIERTRPFLHIEVLDSTIAEFMAWVDTNGYRVEKLFPDKTHCNYFVAPREAGWKRGAR